MRHLSDAGQQRFPEPPPTWTKLERRGYWRHHCPKRGLITVTRTHLGIYRKPEEEIVGDKKDPRNVFEVEDWAGCSWCGGLPDSWALIVAIVRGEVVPPELT